jgi:hypothetical protein
MTGYPGGCREMKNFFLHPFTATEPI